MRFQQGLDLLHRRIEEWTEEAASVVDGGDVEAFGEYGTDLVACLQDIVDEIEVDSESLALRSAEVASRELCEEIWSVLGQAWETIEFAERPAGFRTEELHSVLMAVASVLDMPAEESEEVLEEAVELLDEFLAEV